MLYESRMHIRQRPYRMNGHTVRHICLAKTSLIMLLTPELPNTNVVWRCLYTVYPFSCAHLDYQRQDAIGCVGFAAGIGNSSVGILTLTRLVKCSHHTFAGEKSTKLNYYYHHESHCTCTFPLHCERRLNLSGSAHKPIYFQFPVRLLAHWPST